MIGSSYNLVENVLHQQNLYSNSEINYCELNLPEAQFRTPKVADRNGRKAPDTRSYVMPMRIIFKFYYLSNLVKDQNIRRFSLYIYSTLILFSVCKEQVYRSVLIFIFKPSKVMLKYTNLCLIFHKIIFDGLIFFNYVLFCFLLKKSEQCQLL